MIAAGVLTTVLALIIVGAVLLVPELLVTGLLTGAFRGIFQASLTALPRLVMPAPPSTPKWPVRHSRQARRH